MQDLIKLSHYLPVFSTIISALFAWRILSRYRARRGAEHLLWWGIGVAVYGFGTLVESLTTLLGWNQVLFRAWYISGALLGGAPLALGTVYLLLGRKWGRVGVIMLSATVGLVSIFVLLSPLDYSLVDPDILNSKVLVWQSIRIVSPFINGLAALFLIGGAIYSAAVAISKPETRNRGLGNIYIALGALLPGIGGMMSRMGYTEVLYIGELVGIILIWFGYRTCQKPPVAGYRQQPVGSQALSS